MKVKNYTIVYSGMNPEANYVSVTNDDLPMWAAASGNVEGSARGLIRALEETSVEYSGVTPQAFEAGFAKRQINVSLQQMKAEVSLAGVVSDGSRIQAFNIGNARFLYFSNGILQMHSADHTEAYEAWQNKSDKSDSAYDKMRFMQSRLTLTKAFGLANAVPQFYSPITLKKDDAFLICTERFWRFLSVMEMELDYRKAAGPEEWLKIMGRRVLMKAGRELDGANFAVIGAIIEE